MSAHHCPHCGSSAGEEDHFCRDCGRDLEPAVALRFAAAAQPSTAVMDRPPDAVVSKPPEALLVTRPPADQTTVEQPTVPRSIEAPPPPPPAAPAPTATPRWRSRRALLAFGAALLVIAAAVIAVVMVSGNDDQRVARNTLTSAARRTEPALRAGQTAIRMADVRAAGAQAASTLTALAGAQGAAATISDRSLRADAERVLSVERRTMADLATLTRRSGTLASWPALKQRLEQDALAVRRARPPLMGADLQTDAPLMMSAVGLEAATTRIDEVMARTERRLVTWRAKVRRARAQNRRALAAVTAYGGAMRAYLAQYDQLRADTSTFIAKVDSEGVDVR